MTRGRRGTLALALLALVGAGCRRWGSLPDAPMPEVSADVHLVVRNEHAGPVDVAVVRGLDAGVRVHDVRLGVVDADTVATFVLDRDLWYSSSIAVLATPITGFGVARSAALNVFGGETITFTVAPDVRQSYAIVQ